MFYISYPLFSSNPVYTFFLQTIYTPWFFQYVSDLVNGLILLMNSNYSQPVNIGNPDEHTIGDFAKIIKAGFLYYMVSGQRSQVDSITHYWMLNHFISNHKESNTNCLWFFYIYGVDIQLTNQFIAPLKGKVDFLTHISLYMDAPFLSLSPTI